LKLLNNGISHARMNGNLPQSSDVARRPLPSPEYIGDDYSQDTLSSLVYNPWQSGFVLNDDRMFGADIRHGGVPINGVVSRRGVPLSEQMAQRIQNPSGVVDPYPMYDSLPDLGFVSVINGVFPHSDNDPVGKSLPYPYPSYLLSRQQMVERDESGFTAYNLHARVDYTKSVMGDIRVGNYNSANGLFVAVGVAYDSRVNQFIYEDEIP